MYKKLLKLLVNVGLIDVKGNVAQQFASIVGRIPAREPSVNGVKGKLKLDTNLKPVLGAFVINWRYASLLELADVTECLTNTSLYAVNAKDVVQARMKHTKEEIVTPFKPTIYINKNLFDDDLESAMAEFDA